MKKFLLLVAIVTSMLLSAFTAKAQTSVVATLSHDGQITCFYGAKALYEAHEAAVNGDVITLSSGQFDACDINKAITIRGAGAFIDGNNITPTIIQGSDFNLSSPENADNTPICLEGIYSMMNIKYASNTFVKFIKCCLNEIVYINWDDTGSKIDVNNSYIVGMIALSEGCNATCLNSYIKNPQTCNYNNSTSNFHFENCIINDNSFPSSLKYSHFQNSIIIPNSSYYTLPSSNNAFNCIAVGTSAAKNFFSDLSFINTGNKVVANYDMFKNYKGEYSYDQRFELTNEAAKTYLGTDGTQVGLYGGRMPFSTSPDNLRISSFKVDQNTKPNGKLGIEIKISDNK